MFKVTGDTLESIKSSIKGALSADMIVTSGGSSMGEKDLIINVLEEWGQVFFHGVKIKPGKPTTFAVVKNKAVLGLPGYPTSCLLNAYLLLAPAIRKMGRLPLKSALTARAVLAERVAAGPDRVRFQTVRLESGKADPVFKESGAITGMAYADGYIVIQEGCVLEKGAEVEVFLF